MVESKKRAKVGEAEIFIPGGILSIILSIINYIINILNNNLSIL